MSTATSIGSHATTAPLVDRPRLLQLLGEVRPGHVTLITGPAGSGKTVLAEQWLAAHGDTELVRVARGAQHRRAAVHVLAAVGSIERGVLFVDAADVLDGPDQPRHRSPAGALADLVERAPATVHVLVTCRSPWRDQEARLRARGRAVVRVDAQALAFTPEEAGRYLRAHTGRVPEDGEVERLLAGTEGWVQALQLRVTRGRSGPDPDGDDPRLAAYFEEHVLGHESERVRRFLRRSSVLDELNGSLCGAVTADPAARALLQLVEQRGDFVRRADDDADGYVWHPLFREVLRRELRIQEPGAETQLLLRAGAWHAKRGDPAAAVPFLLEAEAWGQLIGLLDRFGRRTFEEGAAAQALEWLQAIPGGWDGDGTGPPLTLRLAYLHTMLGQTRVAEHLLNELEAGRTLRRGEAIAARALRATWAFFDAEPTAVLPTADAVRDDLDALDNADLPDVLGLTSRDSLVVIADGSRARAQWLLGDLRTARAGLLQVMHRPNVYTPWLLHVLGTLALLEAWAGEFRHAQKHGRQALRVASTSGLLEHPGTIDARIALAHVARERGGLGGAEAFLDSAEAILGRQRRPSASVAIAVERALWYLAAGAPERGLELVRAVRTTGEPDPPPLLAARLVATEVRLLLAIGDRDHARLVLRSLPEAAAALPEASSAAVELAIADGDLDTARSVLDGWPEIRGNPRAALERDLWRAVVDLARGSRRQALQRGVALLEVAEAEGHLRLFLDPGRPVDRLLQALGNVAEGSYAAGVVGAVQASGGRRGGAPFGLTERELAVARYLPTPLSSAEIAAQLYISRNTLKTHLQTVYRKLGVSGRAEAIRRAEELGLA